MDKVLINFNYVELEHQNKKKDAFFDNVIYFGYLYFIRLREYNINFLLIISINNYNHEEIFFEIPNYNCYTILLNQFFSYI